MSTPVKNFAKGTVSTGYDAVATSVVLSTGHGSRFPSTFPFPIVWWNATDYADPADDAAVEVDLVTNRVGDTLTLTRGVEGTSASAKNTAGKTYKILAPITAEMWAALSTNSLSQSFRGLRVQTHPDSTKAASRVLVSAEAIVMDDGQEITSWDNLVADITASGAGGLDTGTEQASTWYSIWAIYNGATKNVVLHREKNYFLDEAYTSGEDGTQGLRSAVDNSTIRIAQGFQVSTAGPLEFIDVKLIKVGTVTGNFWFTVEANSGGVPSNTPLATSDYYDASRITTTATWVRLPFRTPYSVSAATQYHLVMHGDYTVSATNYLGWRMDGSAASYANGSKALYDSDTATWTADTDDDMMIKVYITENDTSVTLPSGYTQKAKIGYAYNNSGSEFNHFWARNRLVFCGYDDDWQIGALTSTAADLVDLRAFLPPVPTIVQFVGGESAAAYVAIGTLAATDIVSTYTTEAAGTVKEYSPGAGFHFGDIAIDYSGVMYAISGGTLNLYIGAYEW